MTIEEQIAAKESQLVEISTAITRTLLAQEQSLDTGQSRSALKRPDIEALFAERTRLEQEIAALKGQLCGSGSTHIIPGY